MVSSAQFEIPTTIYNTLEEELSILDTARRDQHLRFKVYRNANTIQRFTILKIEGEQVDEISETTNTVERIAVRKTLRDRDQILWTTRFNTNGEIYQRLKQIQQGHGVATGRNNAKKQLAFLLSSNSALIADV